VRDQSRPTSECAGRACGHARRVLRSAAALLSVLSLAALWLASSAPAVVVHVDGRALGYTPPAKGTGAVPLSRGGKGSGGGAKPNSSSPLIYHTGPVMPSNTNYAIYWDPPGAPAFPSGYEAGINRFFEDLQHDDGRLSNSDSILAQYGDSGKHFANYDSHFGGALIDTDPYPAWGCSVTPKCLTDTQIRTEIQSFVQAQKLPIDLEHAYFLLTPEGVESCWDTSPAEKKCSAGAPAAERWYCAYHGFIAVGGSDLIYASTPFVEKLSCDVGEEHPNGNASDATIAGGLAHEHSEAVTDPLGNAWYDAKGDEVADKCRGGSEKKEYGTPLGQAPNGKNFNELINGHEYLYQQIWSNSASECRQRVAELPVIIKVKPKSGPAEGGTHVTITGTGFASPATVLVEGVEATGVQVVSATTITAVTPPGTAGLKAKVTVTTPAGTSPITKKSTFRYKA
jgi:hypothetical protein